MGCGNVWGGLGVFAANVSLSTNLAQPILEAIR